MSHDLDSIAAALVADGMGILAADETGPTLTKRFEALGIASTADTRRAYREMQPEVLMDGPHAIERCAEVTGRVLHEVFHALFEQGVRLGSMLLKPNMVIAGKECPRSASVPEVATATLSCLRRHVPAAVPGIVFLSGGQSDRVATAHLDAINRLPGPKPWKISFSYGRALQDPALEAWRGRDENVTAAQRALAHHARCNGAASLGRYSAEMEASPAGADSPGHRRE